MNVSHPTVLLITHPNEHTDLSFRADLRSHANARCFMLDSCMMDLQDLNLFQDTPAQSMSQSFS